MIILEIVRKNINELNPAEYNPRKDLKKGDPEYEKLSKFLEKFDLVEPLVWNRRTGNLVGGHQRLKILKERGDTAVEVSVVDLSLEEEKTLNVGLNNLSGDWDNLKLRTLLNELDDMYVNLTGFEDQVITNLLSSNEDFDPEKEWREGGMPEFEQEDIMGRKLYVYFDTEEDIQAFAKLVGQTITDKTKFIWYPFVPRVSRLIE